MIISPSLLKTAASRWYIFTTPCGDGIELWPSNDASAPREKFVISQNILGWTARFLELEGVNYIVKGGIRGKPVEKAIETIRCRWEKK